MTASDLKDAMRREAMACRRRGATADSTKLTTHLLGSMLVPPRTAVAGYWPLPGEVDLRPLLVGLIEQGHAVLLPETPPRGQPLIFRHWTPGAAMVAERFGTMRPEGAVGVPDVLLVPLLAFDARCNRLGYGGGYYDRTIAGLPGVRTIGCAFAVQQVDAVPVLPHDRALDAVVTERGVIMRPES